MWKWFYKMVERRQGNEHWLEVVLGPEGCEDDPVQNWIIPGTYMEL